MNRADGSCCLKGLGSINTPRCKVLDQKKELMSKLESDSRNYASCGGRSILEILEDELDVVVERLLTPGAEAADGTDKGRASGIAYAIAVIENPYSPSIPSVRGASVHRVREKMMDDAVGPYEKDEAPAVETDHAPVD